jgi:REP element-mobilizing transposase RayT
VDSEEVIVPPFDREEVGVRHRSLPHWERPGSVYSVTFRLGDSLPLHVVKPYADEKKRLLGRLSKADPEEVSALQIQLIELFNDRIDKYLDAGQGACWMNRPDVAEVVTNALSFFNEKRYDLIAWCVMPNHAHVVFKTAGEWALDKILHSWKSYSSLKANEILGRSGVFWQREYYDHIVRGSADLDRCIGYVMNNPSAARLVNWPWVWSAYQGGGHV